ncbi:hypothetical protein GGS23DRAFT_610329 [Durotheca rogersii]|uniref:uncharacterized protein n=1 Tax=Durotheca rogersii TaxID=419775 RepID=UPI00221EB403|nr:uncharacterized protein GGS23DRAFT_610329 [Durotheca rogersii]KAI5862615.1 hypothetical protein GGS23DRAFT_610329 [Durotheca rogersii]
MDSFTEIPSQKEKPALPTVRAIATTSDDGVDDVASGAENTPTSLIDLMPELKTMIFKELDDVAAIGNLRATHSSFWLAFEDSREAIAKGIYERISASHSVVTLALMAAEAQSLNTADPEAVRRLIAKYLGRRGPLSPSEWDVRLLDRVGNLVKSVDRIIDLGVQHMMVFRAANIEPSQAELDRWSRALLTLEVAKLAFHINPANKKPMFAFCYHSLYREFWLKFSVVEICELRTARALLSSAKIIIFSRELEEGDDRYVDLLLNCVCVGAGGRNRAISCVTELIGVNELGRWFGPGFEADVAGARLRAFCPPFQCWIGKPNPIHSLALLVQVNEMNKAPAPSPELNVSRGGQILPQVFGTPIPNDLVRPRQFSDERSMTGETWCWQVQDWISYFGADIEDRHCWLNRWQHYSSHCIDDGDYWIDVVQGLDRETIETIREVQPMIMPTPR